jgi:hypothetical protein
MLRTSSFATLVKLPDLRFELFTLACEISLVGDHKLSTRGAILLERFFIRVDTFEKWRYQPAKKHTGDAR